MIGFLLIFLFILCLAFFYCIKSKGKFRYFRCPLGIVIIVSLFVVWDALTFPSKENHLSIFKRISGLSLPQNIKILSQSYKEYFNLKGEYSYCLVLEIDDESRKILLENSVKIEETVLRDCANSGLQEYNRKGMNISDYPFMAWYVSENDKLWAYFEKY